MNDPDFGPGQIPGTSDTFYRRVFMLVAMALIALAVYHIVRPFLQPLAWAAILALFLNPLQRRLTALLRGGKVKGDTESWLRLTRGAA